MHRHPTCPAGQTFPASSFFSEPSQNRSNPSSPEAVRNVMECVPGFWASLINCSPHLPCNFQRQARIVMITVDLPRDFEVLNVFYYWNI